jgi:hypothetical protein
VQQGGGDEWCVPADASCSHLCRGGRESGLGADTYLAAIRRIAQIGKREGTLRFESSRKEGVDRLEQRLEPI